MAKANPKTGEMAEVKTGKGAWVNEAEGIDFIPKTWEELESAFADKGGILTFEGSAWYVLDKERLVGVPFMIADVKEYISAQYGEPFCAIMLVTRDEIDGRNQFVINDGSTGIYEQVKGMVERSKRKSGIICPNGLRASKYEKVISDAFGNAPDKTIQATTYYVG